ncbi:thiol-disulfide isomerase/thioredoxin [Duganella sp. SG902]|uniref:thioredoxin family protein n=1 Tax=Duganella sp. SG902 TaxID=2587016 RepID=UPI001790D474|nr:thioredoxin family protein [Duganella sp. SG902]NVM78114.1 thiol-disulfide isomerase/thioredoxin [Duganella sp. SG902]
MENTQIRTRRTIVAAAGALFMLALAGTPSMAAETAPYRSNLPVEGRFAGFNGATTWLNSAPLTPQQLRGKVVLVDFWTYSCINCIRTVPYIRAWAAKYRDRGLVVVGVHTPEFKFEEDLVNINAAVGRFKMDYPIALDSRQQIWRAWGNQYWPALYLADANGMLRHHQFGEGGYDKMERAIQSLLAEAGPGPVDTSLVNPTANDEQMQPDLASLNSGETYVGYQKAENYRATPRLREDRAQMYAVDKLGLNQWGLSGQWVVGGESAVSDEAGAGIAYQFSARDLHLVAGPGAAGRKLRIKVTLDGRAPGADHGADIDADGDGVIDATRLYQLVRQSGKVRERRFEVRFLDKGAEAFAFTFG